MFTMPPRGRQCQPHLQMRKLKLDSWPGFEPGSQTLAVPTNAELRLVAPSGACDGDLVSGPPRTPAWSGTAVPAHPPRRLLGEPGAGVSVHGEKGHREREPGTSPGRLPLLTAAWDHCADLGAGPVCPTSLPTCHGVPSASSMAMACTPAAQTLRPLSPQPPGLPWSPCCFRSPLLRAAGSSIPWASITQPRRRRPPPEVWLSPSHTPRGAGAQAAPMAYLPARRPSPVPPSPALSRSSGPFLYSQARGMGAGAVVVLDPWDWPLPGALVPYRTHGDPEIFRTLRPCLCSVGD